VSLIVRAARRDDLFDHAPVIEYDRGSPPSSSDRAGHTARVAGPLRHLRKSSMSVKGAVRGLRPEFSAGSAARHALAPRRAPDAGRSGSLAGIRALAPRFTAAARQGRRRIAPIVNRNEYGSSAGGGRARRASPAPSHPKARRMRRKAPARRGGCAWRRRWNAMPNNIAKYFSKKSALPAGTATSPRRSLLDPVPLTLD